MNVTTVRYNRKRKMTLKLTLHRTGYWCKKIAGKMHYFGSRHGSLDEARQHLMAFIRVAEMGEVVTPASRDEEVCQVAERYARICEARVAAKQIQKRTWDDYDTVIRKFVAIVGARTKCSAMHPILFSKVAGEWADLPPNRFGNYIQTIRSMFAACKVSVDFGPDFHKPARSRYRAHRRRAPQRKFATGDLAALLHYANPKLRLYLMLGLNCGMYAKDISSLRWRDIRKVDGQLCVDWERPKTKIPQAAPLWQEVVDALPKRGRDAALVFTNGRGKPLVRGRVDDIARMCSRLMARLGLKRPGVAFGCVRHTHVSAVQAIGDVDACHMVRGHVIEGMAELYDHVDIPRLKTVTDAAREALFVTPMRTAIPSEIQKRMAQSPLPPLSKSGGRSRVRGPRGKPAKSNA